MPKTLAYSVLDVFAERPFEGNQLAVFHDARDLSTEQMQTLAREMNLSETTFVLPSDDPEHEREHGVRVRIFTTEEELPFAGHPSLGTASWLYLNHPTLRGAETITLQLNVGPIRVHFTAPTAEAYGVQAAGVQATMEQNDPVFGEQYSAAEVAAVLGMNAEDLMSGYLPQTVSTANPFCIVLLRSLEALSRLAIPQRESTAWLHTKATRWFYSIAPTGATDAEAPQWRARMQFYGGEDPATGSAAGPCIAWLLSVGLAASQQPVVIEQGIDMLRPSRITAQATRAGNNVHSILISGRTIPVAEGRFFLP
jgi:trans-2,3-dihydro-3-hydroxyanthranilate isomerase